MKRLTKKISKPVQDEYSLGSYAEYVSVCTGYLNKEFLNKLGKLEDVLEKYGIESVEELDVLLDYMRLNNSIRNEDKTELKLENDCLKEKLENAIVPKFKIGQKVWFIYGKSIRSFKIFKINIEIKACILIQYLDNHWCQFEENCFATEEEARKRLEELKNGK